MFKVCAYISHRRLDGLLYTSLLREVMLILQHHFSRQKQMLSSETRYVISLLHSFSSLSVLFTCLHFISIKNGLTPLEVAIVKRDEWEETDNKERQRRDPYHWYENRDYEGVIDVLSRYSKEPATLPSHDVSRFNHRYRKGKGIGNGSCGKFHPRFALRIEKWRPLKEVDLRRACIHAPYKKYTIT